MDSVFDLLIFLFPAAFFIFRMVAKAKKGQEKKAAPPPRAPIRLKIEDDDLPHWERTKDKNVALRTPSVSAKNVKAPKPAAAKVMLSQMGPKSSPAITPSPGSKISPALDEKNILPSAGFATTQEAEEKKSEQTKQAASNKPVFNLSNLSPLKQAVVMAEILGPPKGMI